MMAAVASSLMTSACSNQLDPLAEAEWTSTRLRARVTAGSRDGESTPVSFNDNILKEQKFSAANAQ